MICILGRPVPKARPEAVRHGPDLQRLEQFRHRHTPDRLSADARKHKRFPSCQRPRLIEDLQGTPAQRDPVLAIRLRARGRDGPDALVPVDLRPRRAADLAGARCRQHQELEGQFHDRARVRCPNGLDRGRHLAMRRRLHVPHAVPLRSEHRAGPVAGVVGPEIHRHRPFQYRADALAQLPGGGGPVVPDRSEDADHVRRGHLRNRHVTDAGEGVPFQVAQPELRMLGRAPSRPQLLPNLPGRLREGGQRLRPTLPGQRIASLAGQLPVRERLLSGFLQRHQGESAEPELSSAAADGEALDPAPAAGWPHIEIEALAVAIAPGVAHGADEGGREPVLGCGPCSLRCGGRFGDGIPTNISATIWRMQGDAVDRFGIGRIVEVS